MAILTRIIRAIWKHVKKDWPAGFVVTALVTIVHMHFGWFDVVDRFAFVVLGHISSRNLKEPPHTVLVVIDEKTQVEGYLNRSPLDRCELKKHLGLIYGSQPRLVVVDIDLSPALWIQQTASIEASEQNRCEEALHSLIKSNGGKTVLMQPFALPQLELAALKRQLEKQQQWMTKMKNAGVVFGDGMLPVERGIVYQTLDSPDNLSRVALCRTGQINKEKRDAGVDELVNQKLLDLCQPQQARPISLDFRQRIKRVALSEPPGASIQTMSPLAKDKVVFFGAHYGEQDRFLTLREEMHGVDLHALGYASGVNGQGINMLRERWDHAFKFFIDLVIAFAFGTLIAHFWRQYFKNHGSHSNLVQERAFLHILGLGAVFLILLFGCLWVSQWLLTSSGIWLSPVPIAIGMLIESFSVGSLMEALEAIHRPPMRLAMPGPPLLTIQATGKATAGLGVASQNAMVPTDENLHSSGHAKSLKNFFWYDWWNQLKGSEPGAGLLILLRRVTWSAILGYAGWLIAFKEH
jgi:CHASE2 domain